MTNEQAIDILEHARLMSGFPEQIQFSFDAEGKEALKMAIKALEQQTSEDCISREAVIKHICESKECYKDECKGRLYKRCFDLQWIYDLPSVTPTISKMGQVEDCVSRGDVINAIKSEDELSFMGAFCSHDCAMGFIETIKELPSVTSQQTRWIPVSERLPEKHDCYLVTTKWKGSYSGDIYTETNMAVYREKLEEWDSVGVIAWMPLPEPYRSESE